MKQITINGVTFEIANNRSSLVSTILWYSNRKDGFTLWDCYKNPSSRKIAIYDSWRKWATDEMDFRHFHVCSYNTNVFSLYFQGWFKDEYGTRFFGKFYITPAHNYVLLEN